MEQRTLMRSTQTLLLAVVVVLPGFTGCKKSTDNAPPKAPEASGMPKAQQPVRVGLKPKWPIGQRYVYRLESEQHSTNTFSGGTNASREDLSWRLTYTVSVAEPTPAGGRRLEVRFLAAALEIKLNQDLALAFNSAEKPTNGTVRPIPAPFEKMLSSTVNLQVDAKGNFDKILEFEQWAKAVAGDPPGPAGEFLLQQLNEGFFRQIGDIGRGFPEHPVAVGDTWVYTNQVPAGALGHILVDSHLKLQDWAERDGKKLAVITAEGTLSGAPEERPGTGNLLWLDQGKVASTTWFDPELGAVMESAVDQTTRVRGELKNNSGTNSVPLLLTSEIGQKISVKLVETAPP